MDKKMLANRNGIVGLVIVVLALLNVWRWWPSAAANGVAGSIQFNRALAPTDFVLPGVDGDSTKPLVQRDLFARIASSTARVRSRLAQRKVTRPKLSASVLRRQQQEADARQAFAGVKLAGVVFRGQAGQAFVTYNGNPVTTGAGQKVFDRFRVLAVTADSIRLKEIKSGLEQTIALSGE